MMVEPKSGPRRLGRFLAGTRDWILPLPRLGSPEACEQGGRHHDSHQNGSFIIDYDYNRKRVGLYKILFHFEALSHNNIFCKHPL